MENASEALQLGFAIIVFMLACMILFSTASLAINVTTDIILKGDKSEYYTYIDTDEQVIDDNGNKVVTFEDIIPVLYRYSTESYGVTIIDNNEIVARFDTKTESVCERWAELSNDSKLDLINEINKYVLVPVGASKLADLPEKDPEHGWPLNQTQKKQAADKLESLFKNIYGHDNVGIYTKEYSCPWLGGDGRLVAQRIDSDISRNTSIF